MRLIDADATIQMAERVVPKNHLHWLSFFIDEVVEEMPTIEAEPVKHGKWIGEYGNVVNFEKENAGCPERSCYCSNCGDWLVGSDEYPCRGYYCPNCGAKMDGAK